MLKYIEMMAEAVIGEEQLFTTILSLLKRLIIYFIAIKNYIEKGVETC